ncbi:hypothetical protein FQZ97_959340 [compost metagenome]
MACQRVGRAHPDGLELLRLVGHGLLACGHSRDQKGHIETAWQVAVGDPVGEHEDLGAGQRETLCGALCGERHFTVECRDVGGAQVRAIGASGEQDAQLFKTFADGCNRLREV